MENPRAGTVYPPLRIKYHIFFVHTVVHKGIAVFFYSTYSVLFPKSPPLYIFIFRKNASALRRVRFFVVGKGLFMTFYYARAPPPQS